MRANSAGNQGPEREAFKVQFGDFSNENLAAIAQNITERLWMDEDDFQVSHNLQLITYFTVELNGNIRFSLSLNKIVTLV